MSGPTYAAFFLVRRAGLAAPQNLTEGLVKVAFYAVCDLG
jgi:hypothetical protein